MMILNKRFILFFSCIYLAKGHTTKAIDMDYFLSVLRNSNCSSKEGLKYCKELCHGVPVVCHQGECYCHQSVVDTISQAGVMASVDLTIEEKAPIVPKNDVQINISPQIVPKSEKDVSVIMVPELLHPNRRHQIAHFCPSLDVARECIRKCVELGKAGFCGKDHKCYCGHKYGPHDKADTQDASKVYNQFADLYAKYLGNSGRDTENSDEYNEYLNKDKLLKKKLPKN